MPWINNAPKSPQLCTSYLGVVDGPIDFCLGGPIHGDQAGNVSVVF